jgi:sortase A
VGRPLKYSEANTSKSRAGWTGARFVQKLFIGAGAFLVGIFLAAHLYAACFSNLAIWRVQVAAAKAVTGATVSTGSAGRASDQQASNQQSSNQQGVDFSLWGKNRIHAYLASLSLKLDAPIAVLSIPRLALTAPVFDGTDDLTLDRGLGRVDGTDRPGGEHNLGIAGHRDGFFRGLKDIRQGDVIEIERVDGKDVYVVESTTIVDPSDVSVLEPGPKSSLTLITCYPFYFVGDAPSRFIVKASLKSRTQYSQVQNLQAQTESSKQ